MNHRRRRGYNTEGRAHASERRRQKRDRAELDREARDEEVTDDSIVVGDGDRVRAVPGPQEVGGVLGDMIRARGWEEQLRIAQLHASWAEIVGPELADRSRPGRLHGGILQVVVEAPRWATQLQYMTDALVGRVVAETGIPVSAVRVVVGTVEP